MGKETTELMYRIARYLYQGTDAKLFDTDFEAPTVEGRMIPPDILLFAVSSGEDVFEDCIASLYDSYRYRRRIRLLGRRWKLLDWLLGPMEQRIYQHHRRHYSDAAAARRKDYRNYLTKDFLYVDAKGHRHMIGESHYNAQRLEQLLPAAQWTALQVLRHGPDHVPAEEWECIEYLHPTSLSGDVPAPPPHIAEWLLSALRGSTFERNPAG